MKGILSRSGMAPLVAGVVPASLVMSPDRQRCSPCYARAAMGGVHVTLQRPFLGDGGLLRLLEPMQLDVTQEQRHHRLPAQDQAWVVLV